MTDLRPCAICGEDIPSNAGQCSYCGDRGERRGRRAKGDWRLKVASVLQALIGASAGLMAPCMVFGVILTASLPQAQRGNSLMGAVAAIVMLVLAAVFFVVTAVGAWRHRRWVRPIMLSVSAPGLAIGIASMAVMAYTFPSTMELTEKLMTQGTPGGGAGAAAGAQAFMRPVMGITLALSFGMYVIIPALFVALYWSSDIQRLCERFNPKPSWTDRCPVPVLAWSLWLGIVAIGATWFPLNGSAGAFGVMLTGWPVFAYAFVLFAVAAVLCVGVFRLHPLAWWGSVAFVVLMTVSAVLTNLNVEMIEIYRAAGLPPQQLKIFETMDLSRFSHAQLGVSVLWSAFALGYMLYLRRFFTGPSQVAEPEPAPST
jgi:hypothetical protein